MMDIGLLRSFVSVVDAGGFTRAGERVHRTQSTVSQQIKRLEDMVGRPLLERNGKQATLTEEGERLISYARRILALEQEARDVVARPVVDGVVRLGIPEDFAAYRLTELLYDFKRARPTLRLDVRCGLSATLQRALDAGELDLALMKREAGLPGAVATWPERLQWVTSREHPVDLIWIRCRSRSPSKAVSIVTRLIHALDAAGRAWHVAYTSPNLHGIQAAVSAGLGVSILSDTGILPEHRIIATHGFRPIIKTELALIAADNASPAVRRLADLLVDFCTGIKTRTTAMKVVRN